MKNNKMLKIAYGCIGVSLIVIGVTFLRGKLS